MENTEVLPILQHQSAIHHNAGIVLMLMGSWSWALPMVKEWGPVVGYTLSAIVSVVAIINQGMTICWKIQQNRVRKEMKRQHKLGPVKGMAQVPDEGTFIVNDIKKAGNGTTGK